MRPQTHEFGKARTATDFSHIDTYQRALNGVLTVTGEIDVPHRRAVLELARVLGRMKQLVEEGASEAAMRAGFEIAVSGMIDDLFPPKEGEDFNTLRRIESEHDRAEDALQDLIGVVGLTPVMLEDWGRAQIRASVSGKACGRRAIAIARKMRSEREVERTVALDRLTSTETR